MWGRKLMDVGRYWSPWWLVAIEMAVLLATVIALVAR